jgi:ferrous iron transport protein A
MLSLVQLTKNHPAKVISIEGGEAIKQKLQNLGIREGATIKKVTGIFGHGPIVVKIVHIQIGLGKGMASKIMVEPLDEKKQ